MPFPHMGESYGGMTIPDPLPRNVIPIPLLVSFFFLFGCAIQK
uniref:Uncharacterized protein n=1 Tax=Nelumbo nucifera TaxID=4432 RepID=A0A822YME9_NELNU|nr:TPA_asm: hypothetical protein HUJ06_012543 [Nelumbo nucifera]